MTASPVQGTLVTGSTSLATIAANFTAMRVGELLIVGVGWNDAGGTTTCTVADSAGQTYTPIPLGKIRNATNAYATQLFYRVSTVRADATVTVTATFSIASTFRAIAIERYQSNQGPWDRDPFDKNAGTTGSGTSLSSGNMTPSATNVAPVVLGWFSHNNPSLAASGGFTARQGGGTDKMLEDLFQTAPATVAATATASVADQWTAIGAVFFDAVPSSGPPPQPPPDLLDALAWHALASTGERQPGVTVQSVDAALNVVAALTVDAASTKPVDATLTATATISAAAVSTKPVDATLTGTATITATAASTKPVASTLTATATITAAAASTKPVDATLTATATISAAVDATKPVDATLANTATITAAAASTKPVDATLTATASRTVAADSTKPIAATVAAVATITAAATSTKPVDATRSTTATVTVAAASTKPVDATLTSTATITVDASVGTPPKTFDVTAPFVATISAAAAGTKPVASSLALTATITAAMTVGTTALYGAQPVLVTESIAARLTNGTEDDRWHSTSATQSPYVTRSMTLPVSSRTPPSS